MTGSTQTTVSNLLRAMQDGNPNALNELFPLVYEELRVLAHRQRRRWRGDFTLNTTVLVHEAYLKLVDRKRQGAASRTQFFCVASKAMRHILCNYARGRLRQKRGGDRARVSLSDIEAMPGGFVFSPEQAEVLMALDSALDQLQSESRQLSDIVECRFFGGMSIEDTAAALGVAPATVKRRWLLARAWLYRSMRVHTAANA